MSTVIGAKKRIHQPADDLTLIRRQNHRQKKVFPTKSMGERPFLSLKGKLSDFFYNFTAHKLIQIYISVSHLDISCHHLYKIKML